MLGQSSSTVNTNVEISSLSTKAEKEQHASAVREEGLHQPKMDSTQEIDLEIEAPGSANKVAEEGAQVIPNEAEYQ